MRTGKTCMVSKQSYSDASGRSSSKAFGVTLSLSSARSVIPGLQMEFHSRLTKFKGYLRFVGLIAISICQSLLQSSDSFQTRSIKLVDIFILRGFGTVCDINYDF